MLSFMEQQFKVKCQKMVFWGFIDFKNKHNSSNCVKNTLI